MFSGIKYILGYVDESPDSLKPKDDKGAGLSDVATDTFTEDVVRKDPMIEDGQKNPPNPTLSDQQVSSNQPTDDWSYDGSIDMADMDDTWEVIPPPCFTGRGEVTKISVDDVSHKDDEVEQPKIKEAARENALIEHPSFYIASTSNKDVAKMHDKADRLPDKPLDLAKRIVLKKAAKKVVRLEMVPQVLNNALEDTAWMSFNENVFVDEKPEPIMQKAGIDTFPEPKKACEVPVGPKGDCKVPIKGCAKLAKVEEPAFIMSSSKKKKKYTGGKPSPQGDKKAKVTSACTSEKPTKEKAWKNKFIVDDWDLNDQEDVDSDFDSMFEPAGQKKSLNKTQKRPQRGQESKRSSRQKKVEVVIEVPEMNDEHLSMDVPLETSTGKLTSSQKEEPKSSAESSDAISEHVLEESNSVELISIKSLSREDLIDAVTECEAPSTGKDLVEHTEENTDVKKLVVGGDYRKRLIQVRPIEPERRPGWQLKRQRSKRRPLGNSVQQNKQQPSNGKSSKSHSINAKYEKVACNSQSSSSRSTPTFIDRIGNSIVANITNLTNGLVSSGALNSNSSVSQSPLNEGGDKLQQNVVTNSNMNGLRNMGARKQLSKSFLDRQNVCAQHSNRQRRPDRRLKMCTTPNGCSVNRKVHTSIH